MEDFLLEASDNITKQMAKVYYILLYLVYHSPNIFMAGLRFASEAEEFATNQNSHDPLLRKTK